MAVEVVSYAFPVLVAALWACARRLAGVRAFIPALFGALVLAGVLLVPAAEQPQPLAPCALVTAMAIAGIGLADALRRTEPPGREDGEDDDGGGGGRLPREPIGPRGGGLPHPDSWEGFEEAFWAHVRTVRPPAGAREGSGRGG